MNETELQSSMQAGDGKTIINPFHTARWSRKIAGVPSV